MVKMWTIGGTLRKVKGWVDMELVRKATVIRLTLF